MSLQLRVLPLLLLASVAPCLANEQQSQAGRLPKGLTIETSGFGTVLTAPPVPYPNLPPPSDREWISPETASRLEMNANPPEADLYDALALAQKLKAGEGNNFIGHRVVRDPHPRYAFQFRSDAISTLARYTHDPRFVALEGGVPAAELRPLADEWNARFAPRRLGVGNVYEFDGVVRFDMQVDEATYQAIAKEEGWSLPDRVELNFTPPPNPGAMDPALERRVRIMPRHDRVPAAILSARLTGRVILRDGCFRLVRQDQADKEEALVIFDRDIELVRDDEGYLALKSPRASEPTPRIGELMAWGGPRSVDERDAGVQALRTACGEGEIVSVGTPSSAYYSRVRPWKIDQFMHSHGITRQEAWDALKHCWTLADAPGSSWPRNIRTVSEQCGAPPQYL